MKDPSFKVGVCGGEEVVGGRENSPFCLGKWTCGLNEPHDERDDTGGEGMIHGCRDRGLVSPEAANVTCSMLHEADSCPLTWVTHHMSPQQASFRTVTSSTLPLVYVPHASCSSRGALRARRVGQTRGNHLMDTWISESSTLFLVR